MSKLSGSAPSQPLGAVATFVNGTSYDPQRLSESGTPIIRISNISDPQSSFIRTRELFEQKYLVTAGDVLVSWSASFKSIIWPGPSGILNQHIFKVTERNGHNRRYIRHAIENAFHEMRKKVVGIGMMHLRRADFIAQPIPTPSQKAQDAIADYLDWIESDQQGEEPELTHELYTQRTLVRQLSHIAASVKQLKLLRADIDASVVNFCRSTLASAETTKIPMGEIVSLREPHVTVNPSAEYTFAGVYSFGRGVFRGATRQGTTFSYTRLTQVHTGEFIYPKLMAWEGALGVVPPDCDGLVVSPEFPVFTVNTDRVLPEIIDMYFRSPAVWPGLAAISSGTNVRRRRLHPSAFLKYQMPLPAMSVQQKLRERLRQVATIKLLRQESAGPVEALLPAIIERVLTAKIVAC